MTMLSDLLNPAARIALGAMLNALWQGALLTGLIWMVLRAIPRTSAATRYAVWAAALLALACLPALNWWRMAGAPVSLAPAVQPVTAGGATPAMPLMVRLQLPDGVLLLLLSAWILISVLMLGRVASSYIAVRRIKKNCRPLAAKYQQRLARFQEARRPRRPVRLCSSSEVAVPMAIGLTRPVIVIPECLPGQLTEAEFDKILLHELAHIRRWDDWTNLAARLSEAVFFFNPAVYWIGRQMQLEREVACDDSVVALTGEPRPYAACLTKLIELRSLHAAPQAAALGAVTRVRQISRRIELLVHRTRHSAPGFSRLGLAGATGSFAAVLAVFFQLAPVVTIAEPAAPAPPDKAVISAVVRPPAVPEMAYRPAPAVEQRDQRSAGELKAPVQERAAVHRRRRAVPAEPEVEPQLAAVRQDAPHAAEQHIQLQPVSVFMDIRVETPLGLLVIQEWQGLHVESRRSSAGNWILIFIPDDGSSGGAGLKQA